MYNIFQFFFSYIKKFHNYEKITVEVVYALSKKYYSRKVKLNYGSTVRQAIIASGLLGICKDIDLNKNKLGIYGHLVGLNDIVKYGDRVEIYRSIIVNPRDLRRKRINKKILLK